MLCCLCYKQEIPYALISFLCCYCCCGFGKNNNKKNNNNKRYSIMKIMKWIEKKSKIIFFNIKLINQYEEKFFFILYAYDLQQETGNMKRGFSFSSLYMFNYMNFDIPGVVKKLHWKGKHQDGNWRNNNATRTQYI